MARPGGVRRGSSTPRAPATAAVALPAGSTRTSTARAPPAQWAPRAASPTRRRGSGGLVDPAVLLFHPTRVLRRQRVERLTLVGRRGVKSGSPGGVGGTENVHALVPLGAPGRQRDGQAIPPRGSRCCGARPLERAHSGLRRRGDVVPLERDISPPAGAERAAPRSRGPFRAASYTVPFFKQLVHREPRQKRVLLRGGLGRGRGLDRDGPPWSLLPLVPGGRATSLPHLGVGVPGRKVEQLHPRWHRPRLDGQGEKPERHGGRPGPSDCAEVFNREEPSVFVGGE